MLMFVLMTLTMSLTLKTFVRLVLLVSVLFVQSFFFSFLSTFSFLFPMLNAQPVKPRPPVGEPELESAFYAWLCVSACWAFNVFLSFSFISTFLPFSRSVLISSSHYTYFVFSTTAFLSPVKVEERHRDVD